MAAVPWDSPRERCANSLQCVCPCPAGATEVEKHLCTEDLSGSPTRAVSAAVREGKADLGVEFSFYSPSPPPHPSGERGHCSFVRWARPPALGKAEVPSAAGPVLCLFMRPRNVMGRLCLSPKCGCASSGQRTFPP